MKTYSASYWIIALVLGSFINLSLFLFIPMIGRDKPPVAPPQIITLEFMAWQQPASQVKTPPKKVIKKTKPKKIIQHKIIKKKTQPKPKVIPPPPPKPVLAEKVIPEKIKPIVTPIMKAQAKIIDHIPEPIIADVPETIVTDVPAPKTPVIQENVLPTPTPIFQLTQLPRMIHREQPLYPPAMKQQGKEGSVKLEILLDIKGKIRNISVIKSAGEAFDLAAIEAIRNSTFMPANINGKPVAVLMKIPVSFRLR